MNSCQLELLIQIFNNRILFQLTQQKCGACQKGRGISWGLQSPELSQTSENHSNQKSLCLYFSFSLLFCLFFSFSLFLFPAPCFFMYMVTEDGVSKFLTDFFHLQAQSQSHYFIPDTKFLGNRIWLARGRKGPAEPHDIKYWPGNHCSQWTEQSQGRGKLGRGP